MYANNQQVPYQQPYGQQQYGHPHFQQPLVSQPHAQQPSAQQLYPQQQYLPQVNQTGIQAHSTTTTRTTTSAHQFPANQQGFQQTQALYQQPLPHQQPDISYMQLQQQRLPLQTAQPAIDYTQLQQQFVTTIVEGGKARQKAAAKGHAALCRFDQDVQEILMSASASLCPLGLPYYRVSDGYLCEAGTHFVSHDDVDAMLTSGRPPRVQVVNQRWLNSRVTSAALAAMDGYAESSTAKGTHRKSTTSTTKQDLTTTVEGGKARQKAATKGDAALRRFDQDVQEMLISASASSCPMGKRYYRGRDGYLCGGGNHFISHSDVDALVSFGRPPRIQIVNESWDRAMAPPADGWHERMHWLPFARMALATMGGYAESSKVQGTRRKTDSRRSGPTKQKWFDYGSLFR